MAVVTQVQATLQQAGFIEVGSVIGKNPRALVFRYTAGILAAGYYLSPRLLQSLFQFCQSLFYFH